MKYHCLDHKLTVDGEQGIIRHGADYGCPLSQFRFGPMVEEFGSVVRALRFWHLQSEPPYLMGVRRAWEAGDQVAICDSHGARPDSAAEAELHIINGMCRCGSYGVYNPLELMKMWHSSDDLVMGVCLFWGVVAEDGTKVRSTRSRMEALYIRDQETRSYGVTAQMLSEYHGVPTMRADWGYRREEMWTESVVAPNVKSWLDAVAFLDDGTGVTVEAIAELTDAMCIPPTGSVTYKWSNKHTDRVYQLTPKGEEIRTTGKVQAEYLGTKNVPFCTVNPLMSVREQLHPTPKSLNLEILSTVGTGKTTYQPPVKSTKVVRYCVMCNFPQRLEIPVNHWDCVSCGVGNYG